MPANLSDPFGPSCCDGGEQCSPKGEHVSAQPCGCDPAANWLCANHKFLAKAYALIAKWRKDAAYLYQRDGNFDSDSAGLYQNCADDLEAIL